MLSVEVTKKIFTELSDGESIYWIGLQNKGGIWHWIDGTPLTYTKWREGEPDGCCAAEADTAAANYGSDTGEWDDGPSVSSWHNTHNYVCKKQASY